MKLNHVVNEKGENIHISKPKMSKKALAKFRIEAWKTGARFRMGLGI